MQPKKLDFFGYVLIITFLLLLTYAGYLSYQSIDWDVLKRLESQQLVLPTPIVSAPTEIAPPASNASPSAVITVTPTKK